MADRMSAMPVEEDGDDVGLTTVDYGCTACLPDFVDGNAVRQRIAPRGKWMCCVKCGASYGTRPNKRFDGCDCGAICKDDGQKCRYAASGADTSGAGMDGNG